MVVNGTTGLGDGGEKLAAFRNNSRHLEALALLNALWEVDQLTYHDLLVPFVVAALAESRSEVSSAALVAPLESRFGMTLPVEVIERALARAVGEGHATRVGDDYKAAGTILTEFEERRDEVDRNLANLADDLCAFATLTHGQPWDAERASRAITSLVERHAVTFHAGRVVELDTGQIPIVSGDTVVAAGWATEKLKSDPPRAQALRQLIQGRALRAAVFDSRRSGFDQRFRNTKIFLDAPEVLSILGHHGAAARETARTALQVASAYGAQPACFESTVIEVRGILEGARETTLRSNRRPSRVERHFWSEGYSRAQIDEFANRIEVSLQERNVQIEMNPVLDERDHMAGVELGESLQAAVHYAAQSTRDRDVKALLGVRASRHHRGGDRLETARAVLLSSNDTMARAANRSPATKAEAYPLVISLLDFAALMWLRRPAGFREMAEGVLMIECVSLLTPSAAVWSSYAANLQNLAESGEISEERLVAALYSNEAQNVVALYEKSTGSEWGYEQTRDAVQQVESARSRREAQLANEKVKAESQVRAYEFQLQRLEQRLRWVPVLARMLVRFGLAVVVVVVSIAVTVGQEGRLSWPHAVGFVLALGASWMGWVRDLSERTEAFVSRRISLLIRGGETS